MKKPASSSSSNKTAKSKKLNLSTARQRFGTMNEDLVHNILKRLTATSLASAACVAKSWCRISNRILSIPKLASALSLNPSPLVALEEVVNKVLSEPIRPQFAIVNVIGSEFCIRDSIPLLVKKLGSKIPIIFSHAAGIMGRDVVTDEFKEVFGGEGGDQNLGISLTVGCLPGLKVKAFPLVHSSRLSEEEMIDNFVVEIRKFSASVSGCTSPMGIILFGNQNNDQRPIIEKLDYAMSMETVIVGDERARFYYRTGTEPKSFCGNVESLSHAIALVFARDRYKPRGIGEIQFHAALSNGVSAIGPRYKAVSVRAIGQPNLTMWLTARREGQLEVLDGQRILNDINDEMENPVECPDLYIGISKRRRCSIGSEKSRFMTSLAFHAVSGGDEEYLYIDGSGIKTGDYFQFYHSDPVTASSSCSSVSMNLRNLKLDWSVANGNKVAKRECLGGFIFSCCGRGELFFGRSNVDSAPLMENFPEVPLAGIFCGGEFGRGFSILNPHEGHQVESSGRCCMHVYSSAYLLVSYTPAPPGH